MSGEQREESMMGWHHAGDVMAISGVGIGNCLMSRSDPGSFCTGSFLADGGVYCALSRTGVDGTPTAENFKSQFRNESSTETKHIDMNRVSVPCNIGDQWVALIEVEGACKAYSRIWFLTIDAKCEVEFWVTDLIDFNEYRVTIR